MKDKKAERQKGRETERQRDRKTERQKDRETERQKDWIDKQETLETNIGRTLVNPKWNREGD